MTLDDVDARLAELAASDDEDAIVAIDALLDHRLRLAGA